MSIGSEEKAAVMRVLDSGCLSGYKGNWSEAFYGGPEIKALEREWCEYFGVKHAIAVNSATSGLWAACAAIGLSPCSEIEKIYKQESPVQYYYPSEVIVSPYSMTCSASIPLHFGAKPVFADIEEDYYCLDPASVEAAITERTKAIIVVALFGQPADFDELNRIASEYGQKYGHKIYVIEDAAQAIGAKYKGRYAGTLGDIGVFSLNRHKHIQCGEGGVVVTDDDELAFKVRLAMNHGEAVLNDMVGKSVNETSSILLTISRSVNLVGLNLRMTELQAAIAREQLKKLEGILQTVRDYAQYFNVKVRPGCVHAYYRYVVQDEKLLWAANNAFKNPQCVYLNIPVANKYGMREVTLKHHYITPLFKMPLFKSLGYDQHCCPVCERVEENIVLAWLKEGV